MLTWLLSRTFFEKLMITAGVFGATAGAVGPNSQGWYIAGIAAGLWLAGIGALVNE